MRFLNLIVLITFVVILLDETCVSAKEDYGSLFPSEVTKVYDGDSFRVNIADVHPLLGREIYVRVRGVDTPEIRGSCQAEKSAAKRAKAFTTRFLERSGELVLENVERDKYFRILADVRKGADYLSSELISSGNAYRYDGGKKHDFCEDTIFKNIIDNYIY